MDAWRYYATFFKGSWPQLLLSILISIGESVVVLPIALLVKYVFDDVIPQKNVHLLVEISLVILFLQLLNSGLVLYVRFITLKVTKRVTKQIREEILRRLYTFSQSYYSRIDKGKLHAMVVQDTERVDAMSNALVSEFLPSLFVGVALMLVLLSLDRILFLVLFFVAPLLFVFSKYLGKEVRERIYWFQRLFENFSEGILFVLQMMDLTRTQTAEQFEISRHSEGIEELHVVSRRVAWLQTAYIMVQEGVTSFAGILILIVGGWTAIAGRITIGGLIAFYVVVGLLRKYVRLVTVSIPRIIEGHESLNSLHQLMMIRETQPYVGGNREVRFRHRISLKKVSFRYDREPVLVDVDLSIPAKGITAIVGVNGVGKSSIFNLVMGFYAPQHGGLFLDDIPYSEIDLMSLRRSFAFVHQDPILFRGTIRENIGYGYDEISEGDMIKAARIAAAHDFISQLREGYDTVIGERGVKLSGGERQRIAIARAFFRDPALLLLDEPANHLDKSIILRLMENIRAWSQDRSVLIISHDPDIVRQAQTVYWLEDGRIAYAGPAETCFYNTSRSE
ncbi:MAG: ABC transporter ATP-binding protein [Chloroflexi bacterium]|nr:ABC transporter ATP-binding protein [Chloroflexota bacterium]